MSAPAETIHVRAFAQLTGLEVYGLARLRQEVFVIEQDCPYLDLDGRDLAPSTLHFFTGHGAVISACLRLLTNQVACSDHPALLPEQWERDEAGLAAPGTAGPLWIGRVVTRPSARGRGLAAQLIGAALARCEGQDVRLSAQAHLKDWYASFGFRLAGEPYLEDGIPHVPMLRSA